MRVQLSSCMLLLLAACTSGGGGGGSTSVPLAQWGSFRHDGGNTALGSGSLDDNQGRRITFDLGPGNHSTPAIGDDGEVYVGGSDGVLALRIDGNPGTLVEQWRFDFCNLDDGAVPCDDPSDRCIEVGPVESTPAVTADNELFFVAVNGWSFAVHDEGGTFTCDLALPPDVASARASSQTLIDGRDLSINSVFMGTTDGGVQALNGDGSTRWRFSPVPPSEFELTSTPSLGSNLFFIAPDGFLYALDFAGRFRWRASVGIDPESSNLVPSTAASNAVYAVTAGGGVVAYNPDGTFKWRFQAGPGRHILGSPAIVLQTVENEDLDDPTATVQNFELIVYIVDDHGTLYGVRDRDGTVLLQDRCSITNAGCINADDCPPGESCVQRTCTLTGVLCFEESDCPPRDGQMQICDGFRAQIDLVPEGTVSSSPIISTDLFAVYLIDDGRVCARGIDNSTPSGQLPSASPTPSDATPAATPVVTGSATPSPTPTPGPFNDRCLDIGEPITSSPVLDRQGRVYFVAGETLYAIE